MIKDFEAKDEVKLILDDFDFEKLSQVMALLEWRWKKNGEDILPSALDIYKCAVELFETLLKGDAESVESGGLRAQRVEEDGYKFYKLEFTALSSDSLCMHL